ncbi:MGH1-like glycoside hydrolase domain-containing protein [Hymenobacter sp. BRD67]|uniref:MGH1-like glycoside hydrolase domain-containing protein n=1 Tax=Hymenobacter sp. BRD67 TaxID=2675877 RepID=UPI0015640F79|nr:glucosidase [Hymenobacter sp. BRD67]QKG51874.1 glucosidase [Hymenobacter sp. BRD67]
MNPEAQRLLEADNKHKNWRRFGPYLSERQWGTVREDYSANGDAWNYSTFDQARSRAYRWGEEGLAGFCDDQQQLCASLALWNGQDTILKEQLFGLSGPQGNHGEDVKEVYYFLDNTPTHSYQKLLYKYPHRAFPYEQLLAENARRTRKNPEFELLDTGIFAENRYFDVFVEYAKADAEDLLIQYTLINRGPDEATLHVLPQLWFRNTWAWGYDNYRPALTARGEGAVQVSHRDLGELTCYAEGAAEWLFCDNDTNCERLYNAPSENQFFKDGISNHLLHQQANVLNPAHTGTKAAAHYTLTLASGATQKVRLRLGPAGLKAPFQDFEQVLTQRQAEADQFYAEMQQAIPDADARLVQRQAFAGMLWSKQFYHYSVPRWLAGDPAFAPPPAERQQGRNADWKSLDNSDIISMPDTWEYPWYAAWDLAFHCIPLAQLDPEFAKNQLRLLCRDWYMHPNGQLPAYEWRFGDVNPPVHAWAAFRVFKMDQKRRGDAGDTEFLQTIFHRLLLNFTWWVNRKDRDGRNIFEGGFLGLDNIGVFDRSAPLPVGGYLEQADGTAWVAMFALNMMRIALELSQSNPVYQDLASKFFEHFLYIAEAMTNLGNSALNLWDDVDEFYYDALNTPDGGHELLKVRTMVGLIPLFAVEVLDEDLLAGAPLFLERMNWLLDNRPGLASLVSHWQEPGRGARRLLSLLRGHRMKRLLFRMLDEQEFLSDYGVRSLSRVYKDHPYVFRNTEITVNYQPAESETDLFGGNSNWRGPIWMPVNFLLVESLQRFYHYYGEDFKVEYPTHSGQYATIQQVASALTERLTRLFLRDPQTGRRACFGSSEQLQQDPNFKDYIVFNEYFNGDTGQGLGASHQTGWTGLIAKLLQPKMMSGQSQDEDS